MRIDKLWKQFKKWVRKAVEVSRTLARRSKRAVGKAWAKHTQLMRSNPRYRKAFTSAASKASARVVATVAPPLALPAHAFAVGVSLYLAAEGMAGV